MKTKFKFSDGVTDTITIYDSLADYLKYDSSVLECDIALMFKYKKIKTLDDLLSIKYKNICNSVVFGHNDTNYSDGIVNPSYVNPTVKIRQYTHKGMTLSIIDDYTQVVSTYNGHLAAGFFFKASDNKIRFAIYTED